MVTSTLKEKKNYIEDLFFFKMTARSVFVDTFRRFLQEDRRFMPVPWNRFD